MGIDKANVRTVIHTYLHPKEVCITNGVTNRELNRAAAARKQAAASAMLSAMQQSQSSSGAADMDRRSQSKTQQSQSQSQSQRDQREQHADPMAHLTFVYPHGLTMNVQRPAIPLLSSGFMAYPLNRPIAAAWECPVAPGASGAEAQRRGKLLVFGSAQTFEDAWLGKEENDALVQVLFDYLLHLLKLNQIDAENPEITDYNYIPDTASLADRLRVAVEEQAEIPRDFTQLFNLNMFSFDTNMVQEVVTAYEQLGVKHEPLTLIHPEFHTPLPPRLPATFGPIHRDPPPPALDLFDLDEHFASERVRLSQLTNKCNQSDDVEFFIREASEIMGITKKLRSPRNKDPRALLDYVFRQVVQYKQNTESASSRVVGKDGGGRVGGGAGGAGGGLSAGRAGAAGAAFVPSAHTKVIRMTATTDGSTTAEGMIPFEPPWQFYLVVDEQTGRVQGQLELHQASPFVDAQTAVLEGEARHTGSNLQLVWHAAVRSPTAAEPVPMQFNALEVATGSGACCLQGEVAGFGGSWQFNYSCTVEPYA